MGETITLNLHQKAVEQWLKDNPDKTLADCTTEDKIILENGKTINLKSYLTRLCYIYKAMQKGNQYRDYKNLTEEEIKWWTDHGMNWDLVSKRKKNNRSSEKQLIEEYAILMSGNIEKARKVVACLTMLKTKRQTQVWTVNNIMKKFQIDFINLQYCFEKCKENLSLSAPNQTMHQNQTLKQFCTENSYNYEIIKYALRLSKFYEQDTLEQIIERAIESYRYKDQESVAPWIYEKYGEDIIDILKLLNVNSNSVIKNMNKYVICIEESLQHEAFKISKKRKNEVWLEVLYNYIIEEKVDIKNDKNEVVNDLVIASQEIARDYQLTNEELATLAQSLSNYLKIMKQYQMVNIELGTKSDEKGRQKVKTSGQ